MSTLKDIEGMIKSLTKNELKKLLQKGKQRAFCSPF